AADIGAVAKDRVWSSGAFEKRWDVDVYRATFSDAYHVYDHVDFLPRGEPGLVPAMELWNEGFPGGYLGRGGIGLIFPQSGEQLVVVRDASGGGGDGALYDLAFTGEELGTEE